MASYEIATAYLSLIPSMRGAQGAIARELVPDALAAGTSAGQAVSKGLSASLASGGAAMADAGKKLTVGLTLPLVAAGGAAFAMSKDFNAGMANVATLIPGNIARVKELKVSVQDMALGTGKSTSDLADGLYNVVSAFGDTADSAVILETNAKAAAAGLATTTDAINLTSGITKAYGDTSAAAVQKASDLALLTVRMGQTTFPELAASMGKVTPIAQAMGQSQEELFAVFSTLTGVTGGAAEVSTQYRGVLAALSNPTKDLSALLKEQGFESGQAALAQKGLVGTMQLITSAAEKNKVPLATYVASVESQPAILALANTQSEKYASSLSELGNAAGATDTAFNEVANGVNEAGFAWQQATIRGQVFLQNVGDAIGPALVNAFEAAQPFVDIITTMAESFAAADPAAQQLIIGVVAVAAAIGPTLFVAGKLTSAVGSLVATGSKLVGWGVTGVQALGRFADGFSSAGAAASSFSGRMGTLGGIARSGLSWIGNAASSMATFTVELIKNGAALAASTARWIANTAALIAARVATIAGTVASAAATAAQWLWNVAMSANPIGLIVVAIGALVAGLVFAYNNVGWFRDFVDSAFKVIGDVVGTVFNFISGVVTNVVGFVSGLISGWVNFVGSSWNILLAATQMIFGAIGSFFSGLWNGIVSTVTAVIVGFASFVTGTWQNISNTTSSIWNGVANFFSGLWNGIVSGVSGMIGRIVDFFKSLPSTILNVVAGAGQWLFGMGQNVVQGLLDGLGSMAGSIGKFFLDLLPGWIVGPFKAALGIASPSKVFRGFGQDTGEGYVLGLSDTADSIRDRVESLVDVPPSPRFDPSPAGPGSGSGGGRGPTVSQVINASPGMSEQTVADLAGGRVNAELRRLG